MFKLGSPVKVKSSSLARVLDKPKIMFELKFMGKPENSSLAWLIGSTWLISQAKLKLNIKLKFELKSSFLDWDPTKIHY